ncbi:interleukin-17F-like [Clinocottus analis]|uniref:interleukin-17F-like n=1 Tax=Clinocottus analis TaxID=304258 RepID=UPI0035C2406A
MTRLVCLQMVILPAAHRERTSYLWSAHCERRLTLQFLSYCSQVSLLVFNNQMCAAASRCVSAGQVSRTVGRFHRRPWVRLRGSTTLDLQQDARTCAEAAAAMRGDLRNRSVSPWKYRLNKEDNRTPYEIPFAECLCDGCIINQHEDMRYNSVPVFVSLMVLRKTPCPRDPNKFMVNKGVINVPVGCTCAVPKYTK